MNRILRAALEYREKHGFSVIPIKKNKKPYIPWEEFQKRRAEPAEIKQWWGGWPGGNIAIITGKASGIVVIDVDEEQGFERIQEYIPDSLIIPTAKTPKGGQHLYFRAPDKPMGNNTRLIPGCDFRGEGGYVIAPPSIGSNGRGYEWLPGLSLADVAPPPLPDAYVSFIKKNAFTLGGGEKTADHTRPQLTTTDHKKIPFGIRDEMLFHIANSILTRKMGEQEIQGLLQLIGLYCCDPPFDLKEIPIKIQSVLNRIERRERNIAQEVREWVLTTSGHFMTTDYHTEQQVTTRDHKKAVTMALLRMEKEGLVEKYGDKRGCYRRIEKECEEIDFLNASTDIVPLELPFGIERKVEIMPGNIIVIAGEMNAGKTALLLNVVRMNMNRFDIHFFSSEMGAGEMRKRLMLFPYPEHLEGWKFNPQERTDNFADVIVPGEGNVNIIDYLELHDNFYLISQHLANIHKKLNGAVVFVAIQKNPGINVGLGGFRGLEKPRLYLAMSPGRLKILKAKNWATNENPNNQEISFKLFDGCRFMETSEWQIAGDEGGEK